MITTYKKNNQTIYDVCLQTYTSLNYLFKLIKDNGIESINTFDNNKLIFDENFINNISVYNYLQQNDINYGTSLNINNFNTLITDDGFNIITDSGESIVTDN